MNRPNIPFAKHIGIEETTQGQISLPMQESVHNHIGTMHSAALFALAETQSGIYLQEKFADLSDGVLPLLRSSSVKYKKPATGTIYAHASVPYEISYKFEKQFIAKGRATISVAVSLKDKDENIVMFGEFTWFVQKV